METLTSCNLCGGSTFEPFAERKGALTGRTFTIVRCASCSLVFTNPRLDEAENNELYEEDYFHGKGFDDSVKYLRLDEEAAARRDESLAIVAKIRALKPSRHLRILDVGCGAGSFLKTLLDEGYTNVEGVELSRFGAEHAAKQTGLTVHQGELHKLPLPEGHFDVVNATEVVEHVRDPMAFFAKVRSILAPGGIFVYSTGNEQGLYARLLGERWPYLVPEGHLFYFNPKTIEAYFRKVGLDPIRADLRTRLRLRSAESRIAHAQLLYVGQSAPGVKGLIFRSVARLDVAPMRHLVSTVVGKGELAIGQRPS